MLLQMGALDAFLEMLTTETNVVSLLCWKKGKLVLLFLANPDASVHIQQQSTNDLPFTLPCVFFSFGALQELLRNVSWTVSNFFRWKEKQVDKYYMERVSAAEFPLDSRLCTCPNRALWTLLLFLSSYRKCDPLIGRRCNTCTIASAPKMARWSPTFAGPVSFTVLRTSLFLLTTLFHNAAAWLFFCFSTSSLPPVCYIAESQESPEHNLLDVILENFGTQLMEILSFKEHDAHVSFSSLSSLVYSLLLMLPLAFCFFGSHCYSPCLMLTLLVSHRQLPAIRTLGSISAGTDRQTQGVLDRGILQLCPQLLENRKVTVRKDVCLGEALKPSFPWKWAAVCSHRKKTWDHGVQTPKG